MTASRCQAAQRLLLLSFVLIAGSTVQAAAPPGPSEFTHLIGTRTAYYTTGPQQGRPPDGELAVGTKVKLVRSAGSYTLVQAENGVSAYVSSNALKKIGEEHPVQVTPQVRQAAESSNQFAFDLYEQLHAQPGNLFFSPASISTALTMTSAGARGQTQQQMQGVLHLRPADEQLHAGFGTLGKLLNSGGDQQGYRLSMANRLWGQETYPFQPDFVQLTRAQYGAELAQVNFAQSEPARRLINTWVAEQTQDKITDLIAPGVLDAMTRLVLTNAIYFKGAWDEEFSKQATQDAPFHLAANRQAAVPLMHQVDDFRYAEAEGLQLLELPYAKNRLSMLVLLPKQPDGLTGLEGKLAADSVARWTTGLRKQKVRVYLPRFTMTAQFQLADVLKSMGMPLAFSDQADFSGIATAEELKIDAVIHKAFVDVNEEGTEAAAATAVTLAPTSAIVDRQEPVLFRADHPFVFLIRDQQTGAILFLGRLTDPKAS